MRKNFKQRRGAKGQMSNAITSLPISKRRMGKWIHSLDKIAVEEPLEVFLNHQPILMTMRTPGNDVELVTGLLFTEGIIRAGEAPCVKPKGRNRVNVMVSRKIAGHGARRLRSHFFTSSSCGYCGRVGKGQIQAKAVTRMKAGRVSPGIFSLLLERLNEMQPSFQLTGGLHAAALFDDEGNLLHVHEDVGRHNAVDKVVGAWLRSAPRKAIAGLLVSGRASYEIIQKARAAGISLVAAVSAPTSLAVKMAKENRMTLVGFLRKDGLNVYSGAGRIARKGRG